jgi:NAD(P)-dependent dehydrogenase (short-subunit alcohol dehydrogenase family)
MVVGDLSQEAANRVAEGLSSAGSEALEIARDVQEEVAVEATVEAVIRRCGQIDVNSVASSFVDAAMTRAGAERLPLSLEEFQREAVSRIPLGRLGQPEDIAALIASSAPGRRLRQRSSALRERGPTQLSAGG